MQRKNIDIDTIVDCSSREAVCAIAGMYAVLFLESGDIDYAFVSNMLLESLSKKEVSSSKKEVGDF